MPARFVGTLSLLAPAILAGCSLAGDWKVVKIEPEGREFPLAGMILAEDGTYTATHHYRGQARATSGNYTWDGMKLTLTPEGQPARVFSGYLRLDDTLIISHDSERGETSATLEKRPPPKPKPPEPVPPPSPAPS